ncbi:hypothetical protein EVAR_38955_1 [Eumeta japonica]|uniref:Uncharacterized protein n=1 Tax=Eumeta variegata TaxID=151549 RepID=A0A4C1WB35_EUMVA|nr:hypothetical protein EVAR_38955_1 [Eumeta japonica]
MLSVLKPGYHNGLPRTLRRVFQGTNERTSHQRLDLDDYRRPWIPLRSHQRVAGFLGRNTVSDGEKEWITEIQR